MSEVDVTKRELIDDDSASGDKLVPVAEAIRYRKRAQAAENQLGELEKKLETIVGENDRLRDKLDTVESQQQLTGKLISAGASDLESAMLITRKRIEQGGDDDVDSVIEQLRREKGHLFGGREALTVASMTSGVRDKRTAGRTALERAGRTAAGSGSRSDVQEYLRVRRQFV